MCIMNNPGYLPLKRFVRVLCNQTNIVSFLVDTVLTGKMRYGPGKCDIYLHVEKAFGLLSSIKKYGSPRI